MVGVKGYPVAGCVHTLLAEQAFPGLFSNCFACPCKLRLCAHNCQSMICTAKGTCKTSQVEFCMPSGAVLVRNPTLMTHA